MAERGSVWRTAEEAAALHLAQKGYRIVSRNWRDRRGELDIIAVRGEVLVVVEVRGQRADAWMPPEATVGVHKQRRVAAAAQRWLSLHPWAQSGYLVRFDVIGVVVATDVVLHVERAFTVDDVAGFSR